MRPEGAPKKIYIHSPHFYSHHLGSNWNLRAVPFGHFFALKFTLGMLSGRPHTFWEGCNGAVGGPFFRLYFSMSCRPRESFVLITTINTYYGIYAYLLTYLCIVLPYMYPIVRLVKLWGVGIFENILENIERGSRENNKQKNIDSLRAG